MVAAASGTPKALKAAVVQNAWYHPKGMQERLFTLWFGGFVYNQIWEDPRCDQEGLQLDRESRVLTIASGGCNVLNYLIHKPEKIVAVDLNPAHIALTRLKIAALKGLPDYESFFRFFGEGKGELNLKNYYECVREHLDEASLDFWEGGGFIRSKVLKPRIHYFADNFYNCAKSGHFLRFVHFWARAAKKDPARLLQATTRAEQEKIFDETVDPFFRNWLVKILCDMPSAVYSLGIPPQQHEVLKRSRRGDVMDIYRQRVRALACDFPMDENYFAWQAFGRTYDIQSRRAVPDYLKEAYHPILKSYADRVDTLNCSITEYLRQQPANALNRFVFLDAQDWMTPAQLTDLWTQVARVGQPGSRILFRSAADESPIESALPPDLRLKFTYQRELSASLLKQDRAAIYGGVHVYVLEN